jgi:hypothetical protein
VGLDRERMDQTMRIDDEDLTTSTGSGSGRGGALGAPSFSADEAPANLVVSGGGLAGPDDGDGPKEAAKSSPSSQDP